MSFLRKIETSHLFLVMAIFWAMWLYTEVTEYQKRRDFVKEVDAFMHEGRRFTWEDGELLKARVRALERSQAIDDNHHDRDHQNVEKAKKAE